MRRILLLAFAFLALSSVSFAQNKALKSLLSYSTFCVPGTTPFIENALAFDCNSVVYDQFEKGQYKACVEITTIFRQNETVCAFSKVALDSPVVADTTRLVGAFVDQQRFSLPNGEYQMEISVVDRNNKKQIPYKMEQTVTIDYQDDKPCVSDVFLVESYAKAAEQGVCTKSGYDFVPYVFPFYPSSVDKLTFYVELYNSNLMYDEGAYLVNYYIQSYESSAKMSKFFYAKRMDVDKVNIILNSIDITALPSGNYNLVVEMRDKTNALIASKSIFFQRSNPGCKVDFADLNTLNADNTFVSGITQIDTLRELVKSLSPLCSETERDYAASLVKTTDIPTMQRFLYNFWSSRAPLNPQKGFEEYNAAVRRVNMSFSNKTKKGYESDRGYVFLKYGQPDKIVEVPSEPGAYPYAIWHYYEVANQHNKRFVFMAKDEVTNDYQLIHSDVIGEVSNYRWQLEIYSRNFGSGYNLDIDQTQGEREMWGTHAGDLYNNPR